MHLVTDASNYVVLVVLNLKAAGDTVDLGFLISCLKH